MNTTELIELARELATEQFVPELEQAYYTFTVLDLKLFAQRIEQPHKQRIAELEKDCDILATNYDAARRASQFAADVADQAFADLKAAEQQIEQLREALQECKRQVMYMPHSYGYEITLIDPVINKALEQTK